MPWPPRRGSDLRAASVIGALAALGLEVGVASLAAPRSEIDPPASIAVWFPAGAAGDEESLATALDWIRIPHGHPSDRFWTVPAAAAVGRALEQHDPQLVILEHLWTHNALDLAIGVERYMVLCAHNVEGALHTELSRSGARRAPASLAALVAERTSAIEASVVERVDQVWACSTADAEQFVARYAKCAPVKVVANAIEIPPPRRTEPDLRRPLLLFVGSLGYPPNAQGALWLAQELMPALNALGLDPRLRIIGSGPPSALADLTLSDAIEVTGFVRELAPHLAEAAAMPVPLVAGGGTRFKVLEAFASAVPVVSTRKGVEGIDAVAGVHYLAAETVGEFAAAITALCANRPLWQALTQRARRLVEERYSMQALPAAIRSALNELCGPLAGPQAEG